MEAGEEGSQQWVHHPGGICQMHSLRPGPGGLIDLFPFHFVFF